MKEARLAASFDGRDGPQSGHYWSQHLVEAAGIEPSFVSDATVSSVCDCENCQQCRAAMALHFECFKNHLLASADADLHYVIGQWAKLAASTQRAIATYCRQRTFAGYQ